MLYGKDLICLVDSLCTVTAIVCAVLEMAHLDRVSLLYLDNYLKQNFLPSQRMRKKKVLQVFFFLFFFLAVIIRMKQLLYCIRRCLKPFTCMYCWEIHRAFYR